MADFITRLAERALGVAPVVQPLLTSMFDPEPAGHFLGRDSEATSDEPDPPGWDPVAPEEDAATIRVEEDGTGARIIPPSTPEAPGVSSEHPDPSSEPERGTPTRPERRTIVAPVEPKYLRGKPGPVGLEPPEVASGWEDRRDLSPVVPRPVPPHPGEPPGSPGRGVVARRDRQAPPRTPTELPQASLAPLPQALHHTEPAPARRGVSPQRALPESFPSGPPPTEAASEFSPIRTLVDPDQDAGYVTPTPVPSSGSRATADTLPDTRPSIAPGMVRPRLDEHPERGQREPRVPARPEPPTIRVDIGRIEVRAITPPPSPPVRRAARPSPALSLDDYLKQRHEGQR